MDQYGDEDYDLDSSMAASKGAPSPSKQPAKAAPGGKMSDFEKMKQQWKKAELSDDGSELEDSDVEEEYGDKDDFDMTPEAVDPVPLYSEPKKNYNMDNFQPTVVKPQSVAPVQKEIVVTPPPKIIAAPAASVAAPSAKVSQPTKAAPTVAKKIVQAKPDKPTAVGLKSNGKTVAARGASGGKATAPKTKAPVTKTNTKQRNAYEGGIAEGKGRPGSAKPGPSTNLEAQKVTAEKLKESGKKSTAGAKQLGGEIAKPAKAGPGSLFNQSAISQKELSPNKQVRFDDDQELPSAVHKKKGGQAANGSIKFGVKQESLDGYSKSGQAIGLKLKSIEAQIEQAYTGGNIQERDNLLNQYTHQANEGAQLLTSQGPDDQSTALKILKRCHSLLKRHSTRQSPFTELTYETLNNIARCYNILGNIKESLEYLLLAYEHVQILAKVSEPGSVTIIPELGLNICNALNYIGNYPQALLYSSQVIESSEQCLQQLERKLDTPIGKISESQDSSWQGKLSQLYLSQFNLHIQGYQAKAKAYENLNSHQDAIREYSAAKTIVEKHFGTNHKLFKELVNQVSSANLVIKNKTYSSKEDNQSLLFSGSGGKAEKNRGIMSQKRPQTAKARSPEREVIQTHGDMIDIRSQDNDNESFFERGSIISKKSTRTEQDQSRSNNMRAQRHRRLVATAKSRSGGRQFHSNSRERAGGSGGNMFRTNSSSAMVRQPPMMAGGRMGGYNRYSNLSNLFRKDEQWKLDHYFAPNMHGKLGYPSFNLARPRSFYFTSVKLANGGKKKRGASRTQQHQGASREEKEMRTELKRMRAMLNQKDEGFDDKMRQIMSQLENQKMAWEQQSARTADQTIDQPQQQQVVPPIHPEFGPALFDYDRHQWVYPYADRQQRQEPREEPRKLTHEISIQKDYDPPKPVTETFATQTTLRQKELAEMAIQTQTPVRKMDEGTSPIKIPDKVIEPLPVLIKGMTPEQAAVIIARHWRQLVLKRREAHYNMSDKGVLYTRKRKYNKLSGAMEIMSMYMVHDTENRCQCLRFTVFNYATKDFIYFGVYDKLEHINEFDVYVLLDLSKKSLDLIGFEKSPFKMHILCMQSIINTYRINEKNQQKIELVEVRKEKKYEKLIKEPLIQYIEPAPKFTCEVATQVECDAPETYLIPDKLPNRALELIIGIQRRVRYWWLPKLRKKQEKLELTGRSLLYHFRKKVESTENEGYYQYFSIQLYKVEVRKGGENDQNYFYSLCANNTKKSKAIDYWVTPYRNIRLPEDPTILRYFMEQAVIIKVDPVTFKIRHLSLHRMKIKLYNEFSMNSAQYREGRVVPIDKMGDNLRIEFDLHQYPGCVCSVWRRLRWANQHQARVVKDWKIKVDQHRGAMDSDYLVVKRLPCAVKNIELHLQEHLRLQFNKRIVPKTLLHILWNVKNIIVFSQRYYDLNSPRYETFHHNTYYMSQNAETGNRFHTWDEIQEKHWHQFYEVYIQKLVPQEPQEGIVENPVYDYRIKPQYKKALNERKRNIAMKKARREQQENDEEFDEDEPVRVDEGSDGDSDGSNMGPEHYEQDAMYWDEEELEFMQLDAYTSKREYLKVTVTQVVDKQDQDYFIIEESIAKWPDPRVEFQYIMENMVLKQVIKPATGEVKISICGLMIRAAEHRFASEENWVAHLRSHQEPEVFMTQDIQRWRNQAINCTVYNAQARDQCYIIEAIHIDRPYERAYMTYPTLKGMRGQILRFYLDSMLKVFSQQDVFNKKRK